MIEITKKNSANKNIYIYIYLPTTSKKRGLMFNMVDTKNDQVHSEWQAVRNILERTFQLETISV